MLNLAKLLAGLQVSNCLLIFQKLLMLFFQTAQLQLKDFDDKGTVSDRVSEQLLGVIKDNKLS